MDMCMDKSLWMRGRRQEGGLREISCTRNPLVDRLLLAIQILICVCKQSMQFLLLLGTVLRLFPFPPPPVPYLPLSSFLLLLRSTMLPLRYVRMAALPPPVPSLLHPPGLCPVSLPAADPPMRAGHPKGHRASLRGH
uniref:Uncharacterized protein n=1 Tax=Cacopsylla melanoneura TaxID=428564 RepID=A0A8D8SX18_9HEMI